MDKEKLEMVLKSHEKWLKKVLEGDGEKGIRANFRGADLRGVDLRGANLQCADFGEADLRGADLGGARLRSANLGKADLGEADLGKADLREANLREADLGEADLREANLRGARLRGAKLREADLRGADLREADLGGANLTEVRHNCFTMGFSLACPEKGAFIGYKKANGYIVELQITENAKRSSATTRKCRCSEALVVSITNINGTKANINEVKSDKDEEFVYKVGEIVKVDDFDDNRWEECSTGIHFFITREEAVKY